MEETMGSKMVVIAVVLVLAALVPVSMSGGLCNMTGDGLTACKPAVTMPNPPKASPACCAALRTADLACLCGYKNSAMLPALGIDPNLAMKLPLQCGLKAPNNC